MSLMDVTVLVVGEERTPRLQGVKGEFRKFKDIRSHITKGNMG